MINVADRYSRFHQFHQLTRIVTYNQVMATCQSEVMMIMMMRMRMTVMIYIQDEGDRVEPLKQTKVNIFHLNILFLPETKGGQCFQEI